MDVHSKETRSYNMSHIRSKDTKPEAIVRKYLYHKGLRYKKNDRSLLGCPDLVLKKYNAVIFVNGCFWHKHEGCKYFTWPKSNVEFWKNKIEGTAERDKIVINELERQGWRVFVVWECELKQSVREVTLKTLFQSIVMNE